MHNYVTHFQDRIAIYSRPFEFELPVPNYSFDRKIIKLLNEGFKHFWAPISSSDFGTRDNYYRIHKYVYVLLQHTEEN